MDRNPYTTPTATPNNPSVSGSTGGSISGPYGAFRKNGTLKTILVTLLVIDSMLIIFSSGILNLLDIEQQSSQEYQLSEAPSQLDEIINLTGNIHILSGIALMVAFAVWVNRSCKNGWLLDAPHMKTTPGWSVGYYFIPILMLWKPYGTMKEIRRASYGNDHALPATLPLWWTFWLLSILLTHVIFFIILKDINNNESYLMACKLDLVSVPIEITLNYLAIALISGITLAQQRRAAQWQA